MKIFLVIADDIYQDAGESWIVGVFTSEERAKAGIDADVAAYVMEQDSGKHRWCGTLVHVTYELSLDENTQEMIYLNGAL